MSGKLYFGDNLDVMARFIADASVDLIYLDPPFNSNAAYNVLYKAPTGSKSEAQIQAFEDAWSWGDQAELAFSDVMHSGTRAAGILRALRVFLGETDMMAYLSMMATRLIQMHRVLSPTGSIYLHCDPTASHYLKILLDGIFGVENFQNEIVWKRTSAHSSAKRYGPVHDILLFYSKTSSFIWNKLYQPYDAEYVETFFDHVDPDGRRWRRSDLTGAGTRNGATGKIWRGIDVTAKGRHWAYPPSELNKLDAAGKIHWPQKKGGAPRLKQYLDDQPGMPLQDVWTNIKPIHNLAEERLGYPTQKPLTLLEQIINASSKKGDVLLDPFCGCGTAVHAAEKLGRNWIGIDVTHLAIHIIEDRLRKYFPLTRREVIGRPMDLAGALELATRNKYQFQWWATWLVGGHPRNGEKKGRDGGVDGELIFRLGTKQEAHGIISVKGGHNIGPAEVRDLCGTRQLEGAELAILICIEEPSAEMVKIAAKAGIWDTPFGRFPRVQIATIEQLIRGEKVKHPPIYDITSARTAADHAARVTGRRPPRPSKKQSEFFYPMPSRGTTHQITTIHEHVAKYVHETNSKRKRTRL